MPNSVNKFLNSLLIPYKSPMVCYPKSGKDDLLYVFDLKDKKGVNHSFDLRFHLGESGFDKSKKTIVFFHGNQGLEDKGLLNQQKFNYLFIEYLPYVAKYSDKLKDCDVDLDLIVNQCYEGIKHLDVALKSEDFYGEQYNRSKELIFEGHSLGTLVSTKVACKLSKEDKNSNKSVLAVLNYCSPVNMSFAVKSVTKDFISQHKTLIAVLSPICCSIVYLLSLGVFYKCKKDIKLSAKWAVIPLISLLCVAFFGVAIFFAVIFHEGSKIGILQKDIKDLKGDEVYFVSFEGDSIACISANRKILEYIEKNDSNKKVVEVKRGKKSNFLSSHDMHCNMYLQCNSNEVINICNDAKENSLQGEYSVNSDSILDVRVQSIEIEGKSVLRV